MMCESESNFRVSRIFLHSLFLDIHDSLLSDEHHVLDASALHEIDAVPEHPRIEECVRRHVTRLHEFDALLDEVRAETVLEDLRFLENHLVRLQL